MYTAIQLRDNQTRQQYISPAKERIDGAHVVIGPDPDPNPLLVSKNT